VDEARSESIRLAPGMTERKQLLAMAGWTLVSFRRYPEAAAILEEGMQGSGATSQVQTLLNILKKTRRHEEIRFDLTRPDDVVRAAARGLLRPGGLASPETRAYFSRYSPVQESGQGKVMTALRYFLAQTVGNLFTMEGLVDLGLAGLETEASSIGSVGYRVKARTPTGVSSTGDTLLDREDGALRILADGGDLAGLGKLVQSLVEKRDYESARAWLNQVREFYRGASSDDPLDAHPFAILWPIGGVPDPMWMRASAAVLRLKPGDPEDVARTLEEIRGQAPEQERWKLDDSLVMAYGISDKLEEGFACSRRLLAIYPGSSRARGYVAGNLLGLGRIDEAESLARAWLAENPTSQVGLRFMLLSAHERRDVDEALKRFARLEEAGRTESLDLNNHAWFLLEVGRAQEALALAERAVQEGGGPPALHTLASVQADLGRPRDARDTIIRKLELFGGGEPEPVDAFVFGRIAEYLGEVDLAASAYDRSVAGAKESRSFSRMVKERVKGLHKGS